MGFERKVMMPTGAVCTWHEVTAITHLVGQSTWVDVCSWADSDACEEDRTPTRTSLLLPWSDGMTVDEAEGAAMEAPDFEEWVDPRDELMSEMAEALDDNALEGFAERLADMGLTLAKGRLPDAGLQPVTPGRDESL